MNRQMFVNLPVKDLKKTIEFFTTLGFEFNPKFTDESATCMIVSEDSFVMLLVENFFKNFTKKEISDAKKTTETIVAISLESREKVDEMYETAIKAGGTKYSEPIDMGFMYQKAFADLDGHQWEVFYMNESEMPENLNAS